MSSGPEISIQTGPIPWNEEEEQHAIEKNAEIKKLQSEKVNARNPKRKRNETKKKVCFNSIPSQEGSSTHDAAGTVPSAPAVTQELAHGNLLKDFKTLQLKYSALRNRYHLLRGHLTSHPPLRNRLKIIEKGQEEEEEHIGEEEEEWFFILARL